MDDVLQHGFVQVGFDKKLLSLVPPLDHEGNLIFHGRFRIVFDRTIMIAQKLRLMTKWQTTWQLEKGNHTCGILFCPRHS